MNTTINQLEHECTVLRNLNMERIKVVGVASCAQIPVWYRAICGIARTNFMHYRTYHASFRHSDKISTWLSCICSQSGSFLNIIMCAWEWASWDKISVQNEGNKYVLYSEIFHFELLTNFMTLFKYFKTLFWNKCTKPQFIDLLTAALHLEKSKYQKGDITQHDIA